MPVLIHEGPQTRIDQAIAAADQRISRREARRLLADARVVVNGVVTSVASKPVRGGDRIAILTGAPEPVLLAESAERIVLDKQPGLASQLPRRNGPLSLTEVLAGHFKRRGEPAEVWVVHRLDTGTSGAIIYARTRAEAARLSALFASHAVEKRYLALVRGTLERDLVLEEAIGRTGSSTFAVSPEGRSARTVVHPLRTGPGFTLADVEIATGRTHQIRVHLSSAGFPILGDLRYGGPPAKRLMLHSWKLSHPEIGDFEAPVPAEFGGEGDAPSL